MARGLLLLLDGAQSLGVEEVRGFCGFGLNFHVSSVRAFADVGAFDSVGCDVVGGGFDDKASGEIGLDVLMHC
jgi:hypothetical protein